MARIRTIKPEFWDDDIIGALSRDARLLFIASWNLADDEGLVRWTGDYLKAAAFMYDDDVSANDVSAWMNELEYRELVFAYSSGKARQRIGFIVNFRKHQRIDKPQPGRLPPPPWNTNEAALMYARRDNFTCHLCGDLVNADYAEKPPGSVYDPATPDDMRGRNPSPDHLVPRSKGGSDYPTNIRTAHLSCNKGRRDRPLVTPDSTVNDAFAERSANGRGTVPGTIPGMVAEPSPNVPAPKGREGKGTEGSRPVVASTSARSFP